MPTQQKAAPSTLGAAASTFESTHAWRLSTPRLPPSDLRTDSPDRPLSNEPSTAPIDPAAASQSSGGTADATTRPQQARRRARRKKPNGPHGTARARAIDRAWPTQTVEARRSDVLVIARLGHPNVPLPRVHLFVFSYPRSSFPLAPFCLLLCS